MGPLDIVLAPPRLALRALNDLHTLATQSESVADGRTTLAERLEALTEGVQQLVPLLGDTLGAMRALDVTAKGEGA